MTLMTDGGVGGGSGKDSDNGCSVLMMVGICGDCLVWW